MVNHRWRDADAQDFCQQHPTLSPLLALRIYTTRLLGQDPALVLHGGGNTSVKLNTENMFGQSQRVLHVKGSGWDMGAIEAPGMPAVLLDPLQHYRQLDRLSDEDMVAGLRRQLLDPTSPNPSVETLLHAFLPATYVDHTHADAVLSLVNQPNAEELCGEVFGKKLGTVPYIMPGFALAKHAAEVFESDPSVEGLILLQHGIFTFGETAQEAYERMIHWVNIAETACQQRASRVVFTTPAPSFREDHDCALIMNKLRGHLYRGAPADTPISLHLRRSNHIASFLARPDLEEVTQRGPVTPDHIIRTKRVPLLLTDLDFEDEAKLDEQIHHALIDFQAAYEAYFHQQVQEKGISRTMLPPWPQVVLVPNIGLITIGVHDAAARIAADIYEHTMHVIEHAEAVGRFQPLGLADLFDMEYWSLEQAKLGKKRPRPQEGRTAIVTGARGGIGAAIALRFAQAGFNLMLTDLYAEGLEELATICHNKHKVGVRWLAFDLTRPASAATLVQQTCLAFGGIDVLVSNAGRAFTGAIADATDELKQSLTVNLLSHQYVAAATTTVMTAAGTPGCLLFNASKSAFNPGPGFGPYSVPKAAVIALMKQYAVEYADRGIRSLAVNADRIRSGLFDEKLVAERAAARGLSADAYFKANLLGREVTAKDVAEAFYQLYRAEKSTGAVLPVDGGNMAAAPR